MKIARTGNEDNEPLEENINDTEEDDLDRFMEIELKKKSSKMPERPITDLELLVKMRQLGMFDKLSVKSNVFSFYEDLKATKKISDDLFEAAMMVLSVPTTQVSVERAFSALALVMDDLRSTL